MDTGLREVTGWVSSFSILGVLGVPVEAVAVTPERATVVEGDTVRLSAEKLDAQGNQLVDRAATWSNSNPAVAVVDATGLVTAQAVGSANITATSEGVHGFATVEVALRPVASVVVTPDTATIEAYASVQLDAVTLDEQGNVLTDRIVNWSSENSEIAAVDGSGKVTGVADGSATITATSEGIVGTAEITVTPPPVVSVEIELGGGLIEVGGSLQLTAVVRDAIGSVLNDRPVNWSSSDTGVASVNSSGLVTGVSEGTATIAAECEGLGAVAEIDVVRALRTVLDSIRAAYGIPALAAVTVHGGEVVEMGAAGGRAVGYPEQVTEDDLWHLGSLTKAMTATLAAVLVERGVVSWDTTVGQVLPDLVGSMREEFVDVRLDELLYHTAGLVTNVSRAPSWSSLFTDQSPIIEQRRRFAAELLALPPDSKRGTYSYTNAGYIVAGGMLEEITGESWEVLVRREVFDPLGMQSTGFGAPGSSGSRDQPWGHTGSPGSYRPVFGDNPAALGPAGTVHTTLADYSKFMIEHLAGARGQGRLLSAQAFNKLHTPAPGSNYAMGWVEGQRSWANGRVLTHNGSNNLWYAVVWLAPVRQLGFFAVTNAAHAAASSGTDAAIGQLIERFEAAHGSG